MHKTPSLFALRRPLERGSKDLVGALIMHGVQVNEYLHELEIL